jgi:hypothetical protein
MQTDTLDTLTQQLQGILTDAQAAAAKNDEAAMGAAHAALADFLARSDDRIAGVRELDRIAADAMRDLTLARLGKALDTDLASRADQIAKLRQRITSITDRATGRATG